MAAQQFPRRQFYEPPHTRPLQGTGRSDGGGGTSCDVCGRLLSSVADVRTLACLHNFCHACRPPGSRGCQLCSPPSAKPTPPPCPTPTAHYFAPNPLPQHSQAQQLPLQPSAQLPQASLAHFSGHPALPHASLPHAPSPNGLGDSLSIDTSFLIGNLLDSVSLRDDSPALPHFTQGRPLTGQGFVGNGGGNSFRQNSAFQYAANMPRPLPSYAARPPPLCTACSQGVEAIRRCEDCEEVLCAGCVQAHYIVRVTRDHRLVGLAPPPPPTPALPGGSSSSSGLHSPLSPGSAVQAGANGSCPAHREPLWLLCETCSRPLCAKCLHEHAGHAFGYLHKSSEPMLTSQLLGDARQLLKALEENSEALERMTERVEAKVTAVGNEIRAALLTHISALEERKRVLLQQMDGLRAGKLGSLDWQRAQLKGRLEGLRAAVGKAEALLSHPAAPTTGQPRKEPSGSVVARELLLEQLQLPRPYLGLVETDDVAFTPPDASLLSSLSSLGQIRSQAHAENCAIVGETFRRVVRDRVAYLTVQARDAVGEACVRGGDAVDVSISTAQGACPTEVQDRGNGTYLVSYRPLTDGEHKVEVRVRGRPIPGTPFTIHARKGRDYTTIGSSPLLSFGGEGAGDGELCRPWGIAISREGTVFVADRSNNRVQAFDGSGKFLYKFGVSGTRNGQFDRPAGLAVNSQQQIIVADKDNHRIQVFTLDGRFLFRFGEKGRNVGQFNYPWAIAVNALDQIAVSDTRNHRVQLFSPKGVFIKKLGFDNSLFFKHFDSPRGVGFLPDGNVLSSDFNNHRLALISAASGEMKFYGREGDWDGTYKRPQGLDIDLEGHVVIADSRNNRVQVLSPELRFLASLGGAKVDGAQLMDRPCDVAVHPDGRIFVVDFGNNKVHAF